MSNFEQFIPGNWLDNIDVNDFVNLNKKPFFEEPFFLKKPSNKAINFSHIVKNLVDSEVLVFDQLYIDKKNEILPGIRCNDFDIYNKELSLSKSTQELFNEVSTSEINKSLKINLISSDNNFVYAHPDFRIIALYGTKHVIKQKRNYLKALEKHLQTQDWVERRINIHKEIESLRNLEKISKKYNVNISEPAKNSKEIIIFTYLTILACLIESPSIYFSLSQIIPFIDIFIQKDLDENIITEDEAQEMIDFLVLKLSLIKFENSSVPLSETISSNLITKTTYRFIRSLNNFSFRKFELNIVWSLSLPKKFKEFCGELTNKNIHFNFINENNLIEKNRVFVTPEKNHAVISEEFVSNSCFIDLEKTFYLALNGGKDLKTGLTLMSVTNPLKGELEYNSAFQYLKEYLSYIISLSIEYSNLCFTLAEKNNSHYLRNSLMNDIVSYKVTFNFVNFRSVIESLYAISIKKFDILKNDKGQIEKIIPNVNLIKNYEAVLAHIITFIEKEILKIPLYKNGRANIRIYEKNKDLIFGSKTTPYLNLSHEYTRARFNSSFIEGDFENIFILADAWFKNKHSELTIINDISDY